MKRLRIHHLAPVLVATALLASPAFAGITERAQASRNKDKLTTINIPLSGWTSVAASKGWLQEEYARYGLQVRIVDPGTSSLSGAEASLLSRGDLHFASRMSYPALVHKTNGIQASIIWVSGKSDVYRTPFLALKDSKIESLADVDGKVFASSRVGCGWSSPYESLRANGKPLATNDDNGAVRYMNMGNSTATVAALLSGRIDFTATHIAINPWSALVTQGAVKVIGRSVENGVYTNAAGRPAYFAMTDFVNKHPELVRAFLRVRQRTVEWIAANPAEAASIVARETRVPKYVAKFQIVDPSAFDSMPGEPDADAAIAGYKAFQKWYKENGDDILSRQSLSDQEIESFVDRRFFRGGEYSAYN
ncbi:MAG: ABC transporter substrate-binding protein [Opitutaceae bacterium]